jgi:Fe-S-cluster containining protein
MPEAFYKSSRGLRFECTRCGACCTRPGPVYLPAPDLRRLAAFLELAPGVFRRRYEVRQLDGMDAVDPDEGPCPFHDDERGCTVYEARPTQCRTFPFWPEIVSRRRSWERAARDCEGIGHGRRHPVHEIERAVTACKEMGVPGDEPW